MSTTIRRGLIAILLMVHSSLLAWSAYCHSPVYNELGHLPAGICHWKHRHFHAYRVNPPLVRMVAALPVMAAQPKLNWRSDIPGSHVRCEGFLGYDFLRANGYRSFWLFTLARWACIPFSIVGGLACYCWARDLYGDWSGLTSLCLWLFCPNVLGNGALLMPDVPAAALGVLATYFFWRWLRVPSWRLTVLAGAALGLAELTKYTLLVLYPMWIASWVFVRLANRRALPHSWVRRELAQWCMLAAISVYVINLGYFFEGTGTRLGDYRFQIRAFTGDTADGSVLGNRFAASRLAVVPVPLPRNYLQGIDTQKLDFERGMWSFLHGEWSRTGWWYFYVYGMAIKLPLGALLLVCLAMITPLLLREKKLCSMEEVPLLLTLVGLVVFVSAHPSINTHFRYLLPAFPFLYVWASKAAVLVDSRRRSDGAACTAGSAVSHAAIAWPVPSAGQSKDLPSVFRIPIPSFARFASAFVVAAPLAWAIESSLTIFPHSLSYFNELIGGPAWGHLYMSGSSHNWGQDLLFLKSWCDAHPEAKPIYFANYQAVDPLFVGLEDRIMPLFPITSATAAKIVAKKGANGPLPGWYAIDVQYLNAANIVFRHGPQAEFRAADLKLFRQVARIGFTTYIFHVTPEQADRMRRNREISGGTPRTTEDCH